ncbi:MAG: heme-binding domain-containing protein [Pyrinomonadaceae bacterium]|nr:heme-binding domain-containing protein [Acidobacteriota bacterium]MDQ3489697.1 heme-binding domain-containing protein [Acidobacteriota bacterium]
MKKLLKVVFIITAIVFFVLQFFRPDRTNPQIVEDETIEVATAVPADVQAVLSRSCYDCHSHKTIFPWYSNVSPFSWFLADHIEQGRKEVNFSVWNTYSAEKKIRKFEEICEQVESRAMPLPSYLWIHRNSILDGQKRKLLCDWAMAEKRNIETAVAVAIARSQIDNTDKLNLPAIPPEHKGRKLNYWLEKAALVCHLDPLRPPRRSLYSVDYPFYAALR